MKPDEALRICRLAKALSPAQAVDQYTPDAWAVVLRPYRFVDAEEALAQLGGEQEWIHVSHIVKRVKAMRTERIKRHAPFEVPDNLTPEEYGRYLEEQHRRIADGEQVDIEPNRDNLIGRPKDVPAIEAAGTHVDEERKDSRDRVREAHERAKRELQAAKPARCSCSLDDIKARTFAANCPIHAAPEEQSA